MARKRDLGFARLINGRTNPSKLFKHKSLTPKSKQPKFSCRGICRSHLQNKCHTVFSLFGLLLLKPAQYRHSRYITLQLPIVWIDFEKGQALWANHIDLSAAGMLYYGRWLGDMYPCREHIHQAVSNLLTSIEWVKRGGGDDVGTPFYDPSCHSPIELHLSFN